MKLGWNAVKGTELEKPNYSLVHGTKSLIWLFWRDLVDCLESLFSNPLFHDQLDFIPCHIHKTAVWLLCVYSEWLTGDATWSIQVCTVIGLMRDTISQYCRISCPKAQQSLALYFDLTQLISQQWQVIDIDPHNLEGLFATCAEFWLNGVFAPFWKGWWFSDPAIFLTLEALHHWHKQFYDHNLPWCLAFFEGQNLIPEFRYCNPLLAVTTSPTEYQNWSRSWAESTAIYSAILLDWLLVQPLVDLWSQFRPLWMSDTWHGFLHLTMTYWHLTITKMSS